MKGADRLEPSTSYRLKYEFEAEGFYVTNGQFKGAMLTIGFVPKDEYTLNWQFRIQPRYKVHPARGESILSVCKYSLAQFDQEFAGLLLKTGYLKV